MVGKMMKIMASKPARDEKGQVFILALILLLLGALIIAPLLGFMGTGLKAGQTYDKRIAELYAADAGVEDAIWRIQTRYENVPTAEEPEPWPYYLADEPNNRGVGNIIEYIDEHTYKVTATATTEAGSSTTVESYITIPDWDFTLENAITSHGDVTIQPGSTVVGDVLYNGEIDLPPGDPSDVITGEIRTDPIEEWPTASQLSWFYGQDVDTSDPYTDQVIEANADMTIGPLYRPGDLEIYASKKSVTITLGGTVYVTGNLDMGQTKQNFTLNLNNQTIFAEGEIDIGGKCTIIGSGCIVAVGDVNFLPNITSSPDDFMLVMSVEGETNFQPNGDYYGAVVGDVNVNLQPGNYLEWVDPYDVEGGINFPWEGFLGKKLIVEIRTWEVSLA